MSTPLPSEKNPRPALTYLVPLMLSHVKPARSGTVPLTIHSMPPPYEKRGNGALKSMRHSKLGVNVPPSITDVESTKYRFTSGLETGMRFCPEKPIIQMPNRRAAAPTFMVIEFVL